ncbi:MAG TPA: NUDIX domain-containing protein [Chloroflexota bacterium]|nr:NUDIX domain-containing protein [Chloroflexota bacterium]
MKRALLWLWARWPAWLTDRLAWVLAAKLNVGACAIIFAGPDRVLLAEHPYKPAAPWQLPGGYLHAGEEPCAGLARELREELGLELSGARLFHVASKPRLVILFYVVTVRGTFRPSAEVSALRPFPCDRLPAMLPPEQHEAIALARAGDPAPEGAVGGA